MQEREEMILLVLKENSVLPNVKQRVDVFAIKSIVAINTAQRENLPIFAVKQNCTKADIETEEDLCEFGTICNIVDVRKNGNGLSVTVEGLKRGRLEDLTQTTPYYKGGVIESQGKLFDVEFKHNLYKGILYRDIKEMEKLGYPIRQAVWLAYEKDVDIYTIMDMIASGLEGLDKQEYLDEYDWELKAQKLSATLKAEIYKLNIIKDIEKKLDNSLKENQKEFLLREQIKVIKKELGDEDKEFEEMKSKIENLKASDEVKEKITNELQRLERMNISSPEYGMIRNYLDIVLALPWGVYTEDNYDLEHIRKVLDEDHYGIEKVKTRIIESIAVKKLAGKENKAPIICLVGPPGVGKTSIAQSIARALGKEYLHMSLGGIRDEAEIRGHRKTYIGSMPGRIMTCMSKAKTSNPLFLLDEIDKMTSDMRGDPSSAMLEVLDPNQNSNFRDNYLEVPFDLSQVMFIMTANSLSTIQKPLLDRMEVIEMDGYTADEKYEIAKRYLIPKQERQNGISDIEVEFDKSAIDKIIDDYTRESGVRELERQIAEVCRKIATKVVEGENVSYHLTADNIKDYLGIEKYQGDNDIVSGEIGAVNGLAWTSVGGVTMPIEVRLLPYGSGKIVLTGSLGDVMKESAEIAVSLIKSKSKELGIDGELFNKNDIHIHVPAGATPKDGPSAGIALATAVLSAVTGKSVKDKLAMTGEITLRGKVLPIGGLKEKTLAAQRSGIQTVIIPQQNKKDMEELPKCVLDNINFVLADNISKVFECACGVSI